MTERIQELAAQAKASVAAGLAVEDWIAEYNKIFAELIVQECAQTIKDNIPVPDEDVLIEDWDKGYIRAMSDCVHHINEHFEVK